MRGGPSFETDRRFEGGITLGSLFSWAHEAGWNGTFLDAPPGSRAGRRLRRPGTPGPGRSIVTTAMSEAWDLEQGRYVANLLDDPGSFQALAARLRLQADSLGTARCGLRFGLKPTNRIIGADGRTHASRAWTWPERNARGRTTCLMRLFENAGPPNPSGSSPVARSGPMPPTW